MMSIIRTIILLSLIALPALAADTDFHPDAKADHAECVKKGFFLGKGDDPVTEGYYNCRANIAVSHIVKAPSLGKLSQEQINNNILMEKVARSFSEKAAIAKEYRQSGAQSGVTKWEAEQSASAKKFDAADHQACIKTGLDPSVWGSPDTEEYYLCRAKIIEQRAPALASTNKNYEKKAPQAALYFYKLAREAQYAFKSADYETHHLCLNKGVFPGELEDPKTQQYYECRAELADKMMGKKVVQIFRNHAKQAAQAAADNQPCASRGYKKGTPIYAECRKAMENYKQCMKEIDGKLKAQQQQDEKDCTEQAMLQFPNQLLGNSEKRVSTIDTYNQITTTVIKDKPLYSAEQLSTFRKKAQGLCSRTKDTARQQVLAVSLKMACSQIMDFNHP